MAAKLYGVIGDGGVLDALRHPSMHPVQPLLHGLGLCHVRTQVALDEPLAPLPVELPRLTESVLGYVEVLSEQTPVIYVVYGDDEEAAAGWRGGRLELGPLRGPCGFRRVLLLRRREIRAVDAALEWLGVRGRDPVRAAGLAERSEWEPG